MRSEYHSVGILMGDAEPIHSVDTLLEDRLAHLNAVCDEDRARHPGSIWGNKITTEQIRGLEEHNFLNGKTVDVVGRFARAMGEYRKIFITRDGRACVESKVRHTRMPMMRAALNWCYSVRVLDRLDYLGELCATVRYEDLVRWPADVLMNVCDALQIEFHPGMLNQTKNEQLLPPEYRHGRFLKEKATEIPLLPDAILNIIEPDLRRLGYL
jgi:hypothetical protein